MIRLQPQLHTRSMVRPPSPPHVFFFDNLTSGAVFLGHHVMTANCQIHCTLCSTERCSFIQTRIAIKYMYLSISRKPSQFDSSIQEREERREGERRNQHTHCSTPTVHTRHHSLSPSLSTCPQKLGAGIITFAQPAPRYLLLLSHTRNHPTHTTRSLALVLAWAAGRYGSSGEGARSLLLNVYRVCVGGV